MSACTQQSVSSLIPRPALRTGLGMSRVSYGILSWGEKQDGSRMIVACMATRVVWGHIPPWENFEFRSSQIASDAI